MTHQPSLLLPPPKGIEVSPDTPPAVTWLQDRTGRYVLGYQYEVWSRGFRSYETMWVIEGDWLDDWTRQAFFRIVPPEERVSEEPPRMDTYWEPLVHPSDTRECVFDYPTGRVRHAVRAGSWHTLLGGLLKALARYPAVQVVGVNLQADQEDGTFQGFVHVERGRDSTWRK